MTLPHPLPHPGRAKMEVVDALNSADGQNSEASAWAHSNMSLPSAKGISQAAHCHQNPPARNRSLWHFLLCPSLRELSNSSHRFMPAKALLALPSGITRPPVEILRPPSPRSTIYLANLISVCFHLSSVPGVYSIFTPEDKSPMPFSWGCKIFPQHWTGCSCLEKPFQTQKTNVAAVSSW